MRSRFARIGALVVGLALAGSAAPAAGPVDDPARYEAMVAAIRTPDLLERAERVGTLLQSLPPEALGDVMAAFQDTDYSSDGVERILFAEWWAAFDAPAALEAMVRPWGVKHPEAVATVARAWARREPEAAAKTGQASSRLSPNLFAYVTDYLIRGWEEGQKPGVEDFVRAQPPISLQQQATAYLSRRWVLRDGPELAIHRTKAFPPEERADPNGFKSNMYRGISSALVRVHPERARAWAEDVGDEDYGHSVYRRVASQLAKIDGQGTLEWLKTRPAGRRRDIGVDAAFRNWLGEDREAALAWAAALPVEEWSTPVVASYATRLVHDDPLGAIELASQIPDERRRQDTLVRLARSWRGSDPEAAKAWMDESPLLDDDMRRRVALPLPSERQAARAQRAGEAAPATE